MTMTDQPKHIGVAVIGLGFMGQTHVAAYQRAARDGLPCTLVAVSDRDPARMTGRTATAGNIDTTSAADMLFDAATVSTYTDHRALLADPRVHLVSICTHTDTHVDLAIEAMNAGKHVVVEKPVALHVADIERLIDTASRTARLCIPAMCMRFWPGWTLLLDAVRDRRFGQLTSARFERLGAPPSWAPDFYANPRRSGGPLFDLHVHDVDFIVALLGAPRSIRSVGSLTHLTTTFDFPSIPGQVVAEGGWIHAPTFPFRIRFLVEFEHAVVDFDLAREPSTLVHTQSGTTAIDPGPLSAYEAEIQHAVRLVAALEPAPRAALHDALLVTRILHAERASIESASTITID